MRRDITAHSPEKEVLLIETVICAAVLQSMSSDQRKELTPIKLRKKAAQFAVKTVDAQREQFKVGRPLQLSYYQFWF